MPNQAEFKDESEDELYIGMSDDGSSSDGDQGVDEAEDLTQSTPAPRPRPRKKAKQAAFVAGVVLSTPRIVSMASRGWLAEASRPQLMFS